MKTPEVSLTFSHVSHSHMGLDIIEKFIQHPLMRPPMFHASSLVLNMHPQYHLHKPLSLERDQEKKKGRGKKDGGRKRGRKGGRQTDLGFNSS